MPRNIYRDNAGLRLVYTHYDRLAHSLISSSLTMSPSPFHHELFNPRPVFKAWLLLALVHSESVTSHDLALEEIRDCKRRCQEVGDEGAVKLIEAQETSTLEHADPVREFGRYPHRNQCLGRESSPGELKWLEAGQTFGVKQNQHKPEHVEL